jgi:hypothetical protein
MPQSVYDYEKLERDRIAARRATLRAEQKQYELASLRHAHASLRLDLALIKLRRAFGLKYRPDQPRIPAGQPGAGRWTDGVNISLPLDEGTPSSGRVTLAGGFTDEQLSLRVQDFVAQNCIGSVNRKIPGEFYGRTVAEVMAEAGLGNARAKTCLKLLGRDDYRKPGKR